MFNYLRLVPHHQGPWQRVCSRLGHEPCRGLPGRHSDLDLRTPLGSHRSCSRADSVVRDDKRRADRGTCDDSRHQGRRAGPGGTRRLRVDSRSTNGVPRRYVARRRAGAIEGRGAVSARKDLGLRPDQRLGVGRLQRRVRHRRGRDAKQTKRKAPTHVPNAGFLLVDGEKGQIYFRLFSYGAVSEPAEPGRVLRRRLRQHEDDSAAPGHPAAEVLRAVLGVVPHAEDALLPLRLVVEPVAGRSGAGRRRRQPDLDLQPVRERGRRHHVAAHRAKHRGSVPVLARRGRSPDRRRVLPRARTPPASGSKASSTPRSSTRRCSPTT